jgi:hypothetical protein
LLTNADLDAGQIFTFKDKFAADANQLFQWPRPRIELRSICGAAKGHFILDAQGIRRHNGWDATLEIRAITKDDQTEHADFCATVRERAAIFDQLLDDNSDLLPAHEIPLCVAAGESPIIKPEDGYFVTVFTFNFVFNIRSTILTTQTQ